MPGKLPALCKLQKTQLGQACKSVFLSSYNTIFALHLLFDTHLGLRNDKNVSDVLMLTHVTWVVLCV